MVAHAREDADDFVEGLGNRVQSAAIERTPWERDVEAPGGIIARRREHCGDFSQARFDALARLVRRLAHRGALRGLDQAHCSRTPR